MPQRIIRQSERIAGTDPRKAVWTPEEEGLAAELSERLRYKRETGELPHRHPSDPQGITDALQELIHMTKERDVGEGARSEDYDQAYNDSEAANG